MWGSPIIWGGRIRLTRSVRAGLGKGRLVVKEQANMLGISMGAFDNYNVLTRYPSVLRSFEEGLDYSFVRVKRLVLTCNCMF